MPVPLIMHYVNCHPVAGQLSIRISTFCIFNVPPLRSTSHETESKLGPFPSLPPVCVCSLQAAGPAGPKDLLGLHHSNPETQRWALWGVRGGHGMRPASTKQKLAVYLGWSLVLKQLNSPV